MSPGAGAGSSPQELGGHMAAWLGLPGFSRGASSLVVMKMGLFWAAVKAAESVRECMELWSILQHPLSQQVLPGHPHQYRRPAMETHASKNGISGGFPRGLAHPRAYLGGPGVLKTPMDAGRVSLLEASRPAAGWELREGIPVLLLFGNKGKVFPHL